jgi:hypothetical protein
MVHSDNMSVEGEEDYDAAWLDCDGDIEMKSLTVVVIASALAETREEFDALAGFYQRARNSLSRDIIQKRYPETAYRLSRGAYRKQMRQMYHRLRPYAQSILKEMQHLCDERDARKAGNA